MGCYEKVFRTRCYESCEQVLHRVGIPFRSACGLHVNMRDFSHNDYPMIISAKNALQDTAFQKDIVICLKKVILKNLRLGEILLMVGSLEELRHQRLQIRHALIPSQLLCTWINHRNKHRLYEIATEIPSSHRFV